MPALYAFVARMNAKCLWVNFVFFPRRQGPTPLRQITRGFVRELVDFKGSLVRRFQRLTVGLYARVFMTHND